MTQETLAVASDGYLCSGTHKTLSIVSNGYLCYVVIVVQPPIPPGGGGGGGDVSIFRDPHAAKKQYEDMLKSGHELVEQIYVEDEEILIIIMSATIMGFME